MSQKTRKTLTLLVNLGTPEAPSASAVRRYLAEFLHDYRVVDLSRWLWCILLHFIILPIRCGRVANGICIRRDRSEERRAGQERRNQCRARWAPQQ